MSECSLPDPLARRRSGRGDMTAVASPILAGCPVVDAGQQVKSSRRGGGLRTWLFLSSAVGPTRRESFSAGVASEVENQTCFEQLTISICSFLFAFFDVWCFFATSIPSVDLFSTATRNSLE
jgi:hypothetical protein